MASESEEVAESPSTPAPPQVPGAATQPPNARAGDWSCPKCGDFQFARNIACRQCGAPNPRLTAVPEGVENARPGDWVCPSCNDLVFARNAACRKCGTSWWSWWAEAIGEGPGGKPSGNRVVAEPRPGDWVCPACGDEQFARNAACRLCCAMKPPPEEEGDAQGQEDGSGPRPQNVRKGDWMCPMCGDHVFARSATCRNCYMPRIGGGSALMMRKGGCGGGGWRPPQGAPGGKGGRKGGGSSFAKDGQRQQEVREGDWHCPSCNDLQFARNKACRRCNAIRPAGMAGAVS